MQLRYQLSQDQCLTLTLPGPWSALSLAVSRGILHGRCGVEGMHRHTHHAVHKVIFCQVVIPRSPIQAKGLLLGSIRDPNPVIFMEPKILYRSAVEQVPIDDFELPLGKAEIIVPGSDVTLLTWGTPVYHCESALHVLESPSPDMEPLIPRSVRGAKVELIDLRSILPWDMETVVESVNRTGRLVIVHEAGYTGGVGGEIASEIQKRCFLKLNAPVRRVTAWE